jgi:hypothetical protein
MEKCDKKEKNNFSLKLIIYSMREKIKFKIKNLKKENFL